MLVLTRNTGETIIIGDEKEKITVTLLNIKGNQAKIGIEAPRTVPVHRQEIYEKIKENSITK
jgi:carbon storage regulator